MNHLLRSPMNTLAVSLNVRENLKTKHRAQTKVSFSIGYTPPKEPLEVDCESGVQVNTKKKLADLEGDDSQSHHTKPDHRQGVFTSKETRVEEADTWNHYPDESGRSYLPCDITGVVNHSGPGFCIVPVEGPGCGVRSD